MGISWENRYIETTAPERQQFYWVGLFYFFAKTCIDDHGEKGERVIRQAVRNYGTERGQRMRRIADANGWPIDLVTLFSHGDLIGDPRFEHDDGVKVLTPEVKHSHTTRCPNAEIWASLEDKNLGEPLRYGSIYCEEVHHCLYGRFDPAVQVNLCETLTNGGDHCHFYIHCRKANQKPYPLSPYEEKDWEDYGRDCAASINTMFGLLYYHMASLIREELGEETLRKGLRAWANCRGERLRELDRREGKESGVDRLIRDGDIFLDFRFQKEDEVLTPGEGKLTVRRCVLAQVWRDHQAEDLGRIFCEEVYRGICETYDPSIQVEIPQTLAEGCSCCRIHLTKT